MPPWGIRRLGLEVSADAARDLLICTNHKFARGQFANSWKSLNKMSTLV